MTGLNEYYFDRHVRNRLIEFLGGDSIDDVTTVFITANGHSFPYWYDPKPVSELWQYFERGTELARSLWDRTSLIAHLDIEYVNFDRPELAYIEYERAFAIQRPVIQTIEEVLLEFGITPLHLLSGRGHHLIWRIDLRSSAADRLAQIGHIPGTMLGRYAQPQPPHRETVAPMVGAAFAGLGQVLELVAHRVLVQAQPLCEIPIELTAVEAGPRSHGREVVSVDLSEYGDPIYTRSMRMPYSLYLKPLQLRSTCADRRLAEVPIIFMIPIHEMGEEQGLLVMKSVSQVLELARRATVRIPEQQDGMQNLIATYLASPLARFHRKFYSAEHDPPEMWPSTYDRTPLDALTPCTRRLLKQPNEWLLKPGGIQHVVRSLMAVGWHPRHIAGLIRSKYERDFGWGYQWYLYDAASRADFYARLFSGLIAMGRDSLIDFNCRSTQEKGYCPGGECRENLLDVRRKLERVASRRQLEAGT